MKKNWFITGISSGLGASLAAEVMKQGDFVIGTFRRQLQADEFNSHNTGRGYGVVLDVTDQERVMLVIEKAIERFGGIDVLVNNAGVGFVGAIEEASEGEVRSVMEANFFGLLKVTQCVLPHMRARKSGHIVQISSHGGIKAFAGFGIYNASKFAVEGMSEALAQEVGPLGIRVSIVEPGPFRTMFAGSGLIEAESEIGDYSQTAGAFRTKLRGVHGNQEGDPQKAAAAIYNLVNQETPPLRLPLGKIALRTIGMKIDSVMSDLERGRSVAESCVYEEVED